MALQSKLKIGFIDGSCEIPAKGFVDYFRWVKCDYMVIWWILNSLIPKISESFMYVSSAKQLWDELNERFGQVSGPLIFQLQRELNNIA